MPLAGEGCMRRRMKKRRGEADTDSLLPIVIPQSTVDIKTDAT